MLWRIYIKIKYNQLNTNKNGNRSKIKKPTLAYNLEFDSQGGFYLINFQIKNLSVNRLTVCNVMPNVTSNVQFDRIANGHTMFSYGLGKHIRLGNGSEYAIMNGVKYIIKWNSTNVELVEL